MISSKQNSKTDAENDNLWGRRYSDPAEVVKRAQTLLVSCEKSEYHRGSAYARLNIAAATFLQSKNETALENLSDAIAWFTSHPEERGYARALYIKGNIYESFGDYEKALELCLKALKLAAGIADRETEAEAASQLGLIYTRLCDFARALEYYRSGLTIREEMNDENAVASSLNRIGMVLRHTKKYDESLEYYFRSLEIRRKNRQETSIPWTLLGIASTCEELGNNEEALKYYTDGASGGDIRCSLQCIMGAGRVHSRLGNTREAGEKLSEALRMATELRASSLIAEAYASLARHYESAGDAVRALEYYKLFQKTRESVQSEEAQSRFRNIEISHAIEKSEQEKEIYRLRHVELKEAYDIIEGKNRDITASINYASRIQRALLPDPEEIPLLASSSFIVYMPKDIVSGDFYWFAGAGETIILAAGDCTGHGVPGALMSMLGISFLEEIVNRRKITKPGSVLDALRNEVQRALRQRGENAETKDGMDIALCAINPKSSVVGYAGAYNNLYHVHNGELTEYAADRMPIGIFDTAEKNFTTHSFNASPGDYIYLFSDGFADQFGGEKNKKYKYSTFRNLLLEISSQPLHGQKAILEREFTKWRGANQQTDDVVVIGFRFPEEG